MSNLQVARTPARWRHSVLDILQRTVHPDYAWNKDQKGRHIELMRQVSNGLCLAYSFLKSRETYYDGSSLGLTLAPSSRPVSPFRAGYPESGLWWFGE